jgi:hypothetical protein
VFVILRFVTALTKSATEPVQLATYEYFPRITPFTQNSPGRSNCGLLGVLSLVNGYKYLGGTFCLYLQCRSQPEDGGRIFFRIIGVHVKYYRCQNTKKSQSEHSLSYKFENLPRRWAHNIHQNIYFVWAIIPMKKLNTHLPDGILKILLSSRNFV